MAMAEAECALLFRSTLAALFRFKIDHHINFRLLRPVHPSREQRKPFSFAIVNRKASVPIILDAVGVVSPDDVDQF